MYRFLVGSISYLVNNEVLSPLCGVVINLCFCLSFPLIMGLYMAFLSFTRGGELNVSTLLGAFNPTYYKKVCGLGFLDDYFHLFCGCFF